MNIARTSSHARPVRFSSREALRKLILFAALILTYYTPSIIYSVLFGTFVVVGLLFNPSIDKEFTQVLKPIWFIALLGLVFGVNNSPDDIMRDIWHILKAITCLLLGYLMTQGISNIDRFLKQFITVCLFLSVLYIFPYLMQFRQISLDQPADATKISLATVAALPLLLSRRNGLLNLRSTAFRIFGILIILLSYGLSLSRTAIGCVILMVLASIGIFDHTKRLLFYSALLGLCAFAAIQLLPSVDTGEITFATKIHNSLSEISFNDGSDPTAMLINWRGFEAYRAFIEFLNSSPLQQLVGRGFGATVDLGIPVQISNEMNYQFIPVLHNGYLHTLAKYGLLGVAFYVIFLRRISNQGLKANSPNSLLITRRILIGLSLILAYATLVISGIYNKENLDSILIVIGVFLSIAEKQRKLT